MYMPMGRGFGADKNPEPSERPLAGPIKDWSKLGISLISPVDSSVLSVFKSVNLQFRSEGFDVKDNLDEVDVETTIDGVQVFKLADEINTLDGIKVGKHTIAITVRKKGEDKIIASDTVHFSIADLAQEEEKNALREKMTRHVKTNRDEELRMKMQKFQNEVA
jgi:hypothetical protein